MKTIDLSRYSKEALEGVLPVLKTYEKSLKQIGGRTFLTDTTSPRIRVEYAPGVNTSTAEAYARSVLATSFSEITVVLKDIVYHENPQLTGGIRVFCGDDMVDVTFERFAQELA